MELVLQTGALGLLTYLIVWSTKVGAPSLFSSMTGIREAIHQNTAKLTAIEEKQIMQTNVLLRLIEHGGVTQEVMDEARKLRGEIARESSA